MSPLTKTPAIETREPGWEAADPACATRHTGRVRLFESTLALVEDLRAHGTGPKRSPESFSPDFQVCLPYRGLFVWHVGHDDVVGDANQVLFVTGGESFFLSRPVAADYGELIITPDPELLGELIPPGVSPAAHPLFRRRSRRVDADVQQLRTRLLYRAKGAGWDSLSADECVIGLLRAAFAVGADYRAPSAPTHRLIRKTKEFLEANLEAPIRLTDVARYAGASPAYLTDVFRRIEGVPLHRYLVQLRLARALVELPTASDLTTLALALGFSSHSHFTAAFRRAFGSTPSQFRERLRIPLCGSLS